MPTFSDAELSVILTILSKADPFEIIQDVQAIRQRIIAYGSERAQQQMAAAAEEAAAVGALGGTGALGGAEVEEGT